MNLFKNMITVVFLAVAWMSLGAFLFACLPMRVTNRMLHPGYSACGRCERTWDVVDGHSTRYADEPMTYTVSHNGGPPEEKIGSSSWGCFPLCEGCWTELATPEARLPYYRALIDSWKQWDTTEHRAEDKWPAIKQAVLSEPASPEAFIEKGGK